MKHIATSAFNEVFCETVRLIELVDNVALWDNGRAVGSAVRALWKREKKAALRLEAEGRLYAQSLLELAAEAGSLNVFLCATDLVPCWALFQLLPELAALMHKAIQKGIFRAYRDPAADYIVQPSCHDVDRYNLRFPRWLIYALTGAHTPDREALREKAAQLCAMDTEHHLGRRVPDCVVCCTARRVRAYRSGIEKRNEQEGAL